MTWVFLDVGSVEKEVSKTFPLGKPVAIIGL
jgi:hypothetical protein